MRISHSHKFIFIANPRTGSTTVRQLLDEYSDIKSAHISELSPDFPFYNHISASELASIFEERGWPWDSYKKFCVVRNPYDRMVSLFHHSSTLKEKGKRSIFAKANFRFMPKHAFRNYVSNFNPGNRLTIPLEHYIKDSDGHILVEDVLMFEALAKELPEYLAKLGLCLRRGTIPHLNASTRREQYRRYYDDWSRQRVHDLYRYEIERFRYTF